MSERADAVSTPRPSPERIEAAARELYERDLMNGRVQPGMWENLRLYYEADASKVLAAADRAAPADALTELAAALRDVLGKVHVWMTSNRAEYRDSYENALRALAAYDTPPPRAETKNEADG